MPPRGGSRALGAIRSRAGTRRAVGSSGSARVFGSSERSQLCVPPPKPRCFLHLHGTPQHAGERHGRVPREVLAPQSPVLVSRCLPLLHEGCSGCPNRCRPLLSPWQESRWGLTARICSLHLPRGPALLNPLSQSPAASPERGTRGCGGWVGVQAVPLDGGSWRGAGG